jgi:hypothetical protein
MKFLLEKKQFYKKGDKIIIEYWYNDMLTPVEIVDIIGRKFLITHNISESKIQNAPDELISSSDIIDYYR